ncbi:uncharacterized protein MONOS_8010 [Monocercomonoides exilis]|uniref:uncharacterized protein n=1 Tax=Monocercomonoides exilis TaxID=2049356 RepID=UPI00355ABC69|nr:hypothetical protein MONOS_8010 [Monocercomonoides exilis]|eukprot:MONOS_8010.1-p1 / transcript=MONOS_8010.1 / gene=MONOS_8010 / organism=Monocercomonoides_exilis_PA203 / gene_product=unspecified product / transcript_product=unspecified product / location=Mono_scaffold00290:63221-63805(-) / protein_length=195 / sequence_SO=supercontig / SO=protein_coding / is_pseudo=false
MEVLVEREGCVKSREKRDSLIWAGMEEHRRKRSFPRKASLRAKRRLRMERGMGGAPAGQEQSRKRPPPLPAVREQMHWVRMHADTRSCDLSQSRHTIAAPPSADSSLTQLVSTHASAAQSMAHPLSAHTRVGPLPVRTMLVMLAESRAMAVPASGAAKPVEAARAGGQTATRGVPASKEEDTERDVSVAEVDAS